jgi:integrase
VPRPGYGVRCASAASISRYVENLLADGYRPASINRRTEVLSATFRLAIREKKLTEMPYIRGLSETGNGRQGFTVRQQLDRVIANLPEHLRDVVLFCFLSSWRKGEVLSLTWTNVAGDAIRLRAENSKEREARSLALEGELAEIIERRLALRDGPLVFHRQGKPIRSFRKRWARVCRLAGIPELLVHDLRRSGVRDMICSGVSPHVAMSISGHKTDSMLKRYAIISESDQREALRRTEEFRKAEVASAVTMVTTVVQ